MERNDHEVYDKEENVEGMREFESSSSYHSFSLKRSREKALLMTVAWNYGSTSHS